MITEIIETPYGLATIEPFREGWRVHIPGHSLAVKPTREEAISEALKLAEKEAAYQLQQQMHLKDKR